MSRSVKVAKVSQIEDQSGLCVEAEGKRIALFNVGGTFYAIDDTCTHQGGPLSEGTLDGQVVECPWHCARFNVVTGEVTAPPAGANVVNYPVRVNGDDVEVELP